MAVSESVAGLRSKRALARCLVGRSATRMLATGLIVVAAGRAIVTDWNLADVVVLALGVALIGPVEWLMHRHLFHASETSWRWRKLGTGKRHRHHHDDPTNLDWLLLDRRGVMVLMVGVAILVAFWALPVALMLGRNPLGPYLSSLLIAWLALAGYEWTHLLTHSGYRLTSRRYRRLAHRHLSHHHRDESKWFGVTSHVSDRLFGTVLK